MRKFFAMYVLGASLGRGATSEVFAVAGDDQLAIKRLHPHLLGDARAVARFAAELERTRAISHPNVARVHAIGDGFLVLERIHGETLAARLARGAIAEDEVRELGAEIAHGMAAVHARGIVHRDLKPANVMLAGATPKIVDFGIARSLACDALATSTRIGTPAYMAPEQWTAGLVTPAGDVWALGAMLFEAATGSLPFDDFAGGRCPQLVEPAPPARCSPVLARAIAACLDRDPARRPSMVALAEMLRSDERMTQDVESEPVVKRKRRWPVVAAMGIALATAGYALVPKQAASSLPVPVPELTTLAAPQPPAVVASPSPQPLVVPARIAAPPTRHAKSRTPIRRAGETLD
ncbi:MAG: serine/threonine-protein kinase [Deltaproteobacteria bacterium]